MIALWCALFLSSLTLRLSGGFWISYALLFLSALYQLIDLFFIFKLKTRFHPSLLMHLLHPSSFWSSAKKLGAISFSFFSLCALTIFTWGFSHFGPFLSKIHPLLFLLPLPFLLKKRRKKKTSSLPLPPFHFKGPKQFELSIKREEKPHLIFLFLESFRAKNVGCLGAAKPLSPYFDKLAEKGILFSQFHSTGNLTYRSTIASLYGIPPADNRWFLGKYGDLPLVGVPQILGKNGYHTGLIQGGPISFDQGNEFFRKQGFQTVLGKRDIEKEIPASKGMSWGLFDEHLMEYASQWLTKQAQPTFLTLFTITNHHPWEAPLPWGSGFLNTFAYTDWALGLFIEKLRSQNLLEKSILFILGDHGQELEDRDPHYAINRHLYQDNIHVPLLIYAEGRIRNNLTINKLSSQIDLLPTVVDLLNIPGSYQGLGKSLLRKEEPIIHFSHPFDLPIFGCRKGDKKLLIEKNREELFDLSSDPEEKRPLPTDEELKKEALAYRDQLEGIYSHLNVAKKEVLIPDQLEFSSLRVLDADLKLSPHIVSLSLSHCLLVTDKGIASALEQGPNLEKLLLEGLDEITGEGWAPLPHLIHFKAVDCPRLGDHWIAWLKKCTTLRILQLRHDSLTDEQLLSLAETLHDLIHLHLAGSSLITDRGLQALRKANPHLITVSIEECPLVHKNHCLQN